MGVGHGRLETEIVSSNPAYGKDVCPRLSALCWIVLSCVGRGPCEGLIPCPRGPANVEKRRFETSPT
jgi:hypothetical protein